MAQITEGIDLSPIQAAGLSFDEAAANLRANARLLTGATISSTCEDCERCTWNPGPDCGKADHPHCKVCGDCQYRHEDQDHEPERFSESP